MERGMKANVVVTVLAVDRTGIVRALSEAIAARGGNWLESRMARMAGHFAGILRVECDEAEVDALVDDLRAIDGLSIQASRQQADPEIGRRLMSIDIVGNDRPGIVKALAAAIAGVGANVDDLHTALESAPMAGHPLFHARGIVSLPESLADGVLIEAIENLGPDLAVTIEN